MNKILVLLNSYTDLQHVTATAINVSKTTPSILHAVFIIRDPAVANHDNFYPGCLFRGKNKFDGNEIAEEDILLKENHSQAFEDMCLHAAVNFKIEAHREITTGRLIEVISSADLIITNAAESLDQHHFFDLLNNAHCPIYLVSKTVKNIENIILTYDGSLSSIYAIKKFSRLFPGLLCLQSYLVHVASAESDEFPREKNIKSWLPMHYSNVEFKVLNGDVCDELVNYVNAIPGSLTVMGSSGKNKPSHAFRRRLANEIIIKGRSDLFITME